MRKILLLKLLFAVAASTNAQSTYINSCGDEHIINAIPASPNAHCLYNRDGKLISQPEDFNPPDPYVAGMSKVDGGVPYKSYVFPNWRIPQKFTEGMPVYSCFDEFPLAYWWSDKKCNLYAYYFLKQLAPKKRLISYLTTPSFHYKVYSDGSVKILDADTLAIVAEKPAEFTISPAELEEFHGQFNVEREIDRDRTHNVLVHPCDVAKRSHFWAGNSSYELYGIPKGVISAATVDNGKYLALLETGPEKNDYNRIARIYNNHWDFFWELIDSHGKVLFKNEYKGKENLTAILSVPAISSANNTREQYKKGDELLPNAKYLLAGTDIEDTTVTNKAPTNRDFCATLYDKTGEIIWKRKYGGIGNEHCTAALATRDGRYFILAGITRSPISRDVRKAPVAYSIAKDMDYWCIKIDMRGKIVWDARFGTTSRDSLNSIAEATNGDILLGGFTSGMVNIPADNRGNTHSVALPGNNYYVVKIDSMGTLKWMNIFGGSGNDRLYQIIPSETNKRFHLWGMSDSKELFPPDVTSKTQFSSILDTTYERTTTYLWHVTIDENGKKLSSSFEMPEPQPHGGLWSPTEKNVFTYGYVYRISDDYEFNKEYLFVDNIMQVFSDGGGYTFTESVDALFFPKKITVKETIFKDIMQFGVHSEETNRLLPNSERPAHPVKKHDVGKMPDKKDTKPTNKKDPGNLFPPKKTNDKNKQVEEPNVKPKEQEAPDSIVVPEKRKGNSTGTKGKQTKETSSKSKVEKPDIKPKEQKAPDSIGAPVEKNIFNQKDLYKGKNQKALTEKDKKASEKKAAVSKNNKTKRVSDEKIVLDTLLKKEVKKVNDKK